MNPEIQEIDDGTNYIGYHEALSLIYSNVQLLSSEMIPLELSHNRIASKDVTAFVSCPSTDISLKDGFAVNSEDVAQASTQSPVSLEVIASVFAGSAFDGKVRSGTAIKVCSGAPIPCGAESVVSKEFCKEITNREVQILAKAERGRNILKAGGTISSGATAVKKGEMFLPGNMGLAAAGGISRVSVHKLPRVAIVGIGDEIVAPGEHLRPGQIYASNLITLRAWLNSFHIECITSVVRDDVDSIARELKRILCNADVILTSGGAWGSERDLIVDTLAALGWQQVFHHVRMGPGKGICFGKWQEVPVFCLPGGPASNEMAFLQLALPGILRMSGDMRHPLQNVSARLTKDLKSRHRAWAEFLPAVLSIDSKAVYSVYPQQAYQRAQANVGANCLICIHEGIETLSRNEIIKVQILVPHLGMIEEAGLF